MLVGWCWKPLYYTIITICNSEILFCIDFSVVPTTCVLWCCQKAAVLDMCPHWGLKLVCWLFGTVSGLISSRKSCLVHQVWVHQDHICSKRDDSGIWFWTVLMTQPKWWYVFNCVVFGYISSWPFCFKAGGGLVLILSKWVLFACGSASTTNRQFMILSTDFSWLSWWRYCYPDYFQLLAWANLADLHSGSL